MLTDLSGRQYTKLMKLEVEEVSLVRKAANGEAVLMYKAASAPAGSVPPALRSIIAETEKQTGAGVANSAAPACTPERADTETILKLLSPAQ